MDIFDIYAYLLYMCIKFQGQDGARPHDSLEKLTRDSFSSSLALIFAMVFSIVLFKIVPYRKFLFSFGHPVFGISLGILQIVALHYFILHKIKIHYTEEKIREISLSYSFISSKATAYISIALIIIVFSLLVLLLILLTASALANKPLKIG